MLLSLIAFWACLSAVHAWAPSQKCQAAADKFCAADCYTKIKGRPCDGPMHARLSGPGTLEWRCYSPSTLLHNTSYHSGICYCSRDQQIKQTFSQCGDPDFQIKRVFKPGYAGMSCYRIPAIVRTAKGSLVAFAEGRKAWRPSARDCGDGEVHGIAVSRSTDHGKTWSTVSFAAGGLGTQYPVGNPYPIALSDGRVALVFGNKTKGAGGVGPGNGIVFSDDDGITWSRPFQIGAQFGPAKGAMPGPGAGVELRDSKRLLVVLHLGAYVRDYITYSDDGGRTWATIDTTFPKMDEATFADLGGGEVLLNMRHMDEAKGRAVARSKDGGLTWSDISFDATLIGPVCQGSLASIGSSVFFSNPASTSGRNHLTVRKSNDGGRTWPESLLIQEGSSAGYSSLVNGAIEGESGTQGGILYESTTPGAIDFATFPLNFGKLDGRTPALIVWA